MIFSVFSKNSGFWVFLVNPTVVSVLLSASVERCFVSRMRDFLFTLDWSTILSTHNLTQLSQCYHFDHEQMFWNSLVWYRKFYCFGGCLGRLADMEDQFLPITFPPACNCLFQPPVSSLEALTRPNTLLIPALWHDVEWVLQL